MVKRAVSIYRYQMHGEIPGQGMRLLVFTAATYKHEF